MGDHAAVSVRAPDHGRSTQSIARLALGARFRLRTHLVTRPRPSATVDAIVRLIGVHPSLTTPEPSAELMVDGFPGSANTYFFAEFAAAQSSPRQLVGHSHSPVRVRAAIELGIPAAILIRDPVGAVVSTVIRWPYISMPVALRSWQRFYAHLLPVRDEAVVATFTQVTGTLDEVVRAINARFHTSFDEPAPCARRPASGPDRERLKAELHERLVGSSRNTRLIEGCNDLYREFVP